ncbi:MAG: condensation domain-containing protein [Bacteroidota bacterium]
MDDIKTKKQIEAIYPLTEMQRSLLFHHLSNQNDKGLLHVQLKLHGKLNIPLFKDAWQKTSDRHTTLRTSIHWKKIQNPIQLVNPKATFEWDLLDWTNKEGEAQELLLEQVKARQRGEGVTLEKSPLAKITLIKTATDQYIFLWLCHHILLDGWSTGIVIEDALKIYKGLITQTQAALNTVPSYKSYLNWFIKKDTDREKAFWTDALMGLKNTTLFGDNGTTKDATSRHFEKRLPQQFSQELKNTAKSYQVSINTLFQAAYALLLHKFFSNNDLVFGTTVSGRSIDFPNIHLMTGMFMNVLPVRSKITATANTSDFVKQLQKQFLASRNYETVTADQIVQWMDMTSGSVLYDSLFIFENYPWNDMEVEGLTVSDFKSGLTSTYPITFVIKETDTFEIDLMFEAGIITDRLAHWILDGFEKLLHVLCMPNAFSISDAMETMDSPPAFNNVNQKNESVDWEVMDISHIPARTTEELELTKIWESVLGIHPIGIEDNFFELGGKSVQALRMFTLVERQMGLKKPPTLLIEHPTIAELAKMLSSGEKTEAFKYVVPIRSKGSKPPLFCIHAGGGHVFFYKPLSDKLSEDQPVYGVQSSGISNLEDIMQDIEEMAEKYIQEMRIVQPTGTLNVLVYCFSTAVGVEMASYLEKKGEHINLIVMDTYAHRDNFKRSFMQLRIYGFLSRLLTNPFNAVQTIFSTRIQRNSEKINVGTTKGKQEVKVEKIRSVLENAHNRYQWKKIKGDIWLILLPRSNKMYNPFVIKTWEDLVMGTINIVELSNITHFDAFKDTNSEVTAKGVEKCMIG